MFRTACHNPTAAVRLPLFSTLLTRSGDSFSAAEIALEIGLPRALRLVIAQTNFRSRLKWRLSWLYLLLI
jgi:hypothetical protein